MVYVNCRTIEINKMHKNRDRMKRKYIKNRLKSVRRLTEIENSAIIHTVARSCNKFVIFVINKSDNV